MRSYLANRNVKLNQPSTLSTVSSEMLIGWLFCLLVRLVGQVVKASASRAEGPGFESRLRRDFFGVESYQ